MGKHSAGALEASWTYSQPEEVRDWTEAGAQSGVPLGQWVSILSSGHDGIGLLLSEVHPTFHGCE